MSYIIDAPVKKNAVSVMGTLIFGVIGVISLLETLIVAFVLTVGMKVPEVDVPITNRNTVD